MDSGIIGSNGASSASAQGRRRDSLFLRASVLRPADGCRFDIVVRNLSAGGLLADTASGLIAGDGVIVMLRNVGEVPGRVAWVQAGRFGIAFDTAIDAVLVSGGDGGADRLAPRRGRSPLR
jgi:hypothetical protein